MNLYIIVAAAENGAIGLDNQLLWRLPDDLKRFKKLTMGCPIIMGRKTFESIGKPLPGRTSIIITRTEKYAAEGAIVTHSLDQAIEIAAQQGSAEAFIIGGGEIYRQALDAGLVDGIYLTRVHTQCKGDTWFELPNASQWEGRNEVRHPKDDRHEFAFEFVDLVRRNAP